MTSWIEHLIPYSSFFITFDHVYLQQSERFMLHHEGRSDCTLIKPLKIHETIIRALLCNYKLDLQKYDDLDSLNKSYLSVRMLSSSIKRIAKAELIRSFVITSCLWIRELDLRLCIPRFERDIMGKLIPIVSNSAENSETWEMKSNHSIYWVIHGVC